MKRLALAICAFLLCLPNIGAKGPDWSTGRLLFTSTLTDGYQIYRLAFYMGDQGAILWNKAGRFQAIDDPGGDCPSCLVIQSMMDDMLADCKANSADLCNQEAHLRYHLDTCGPSKTPCLAIELPEIRSLGRAGKKRTFFVVTQIRPAADVASDLRKACAVMHPDSTPDCEATPTK
jgi:hypothetical protein